VRVTVVRAVIQANRERGIVVEGTVDIPASVRAPVGDIARSAERAGLEAEARSPEFRSWWAFGSRFWGGCPVVAGFQGRRSPNSVGTHLAT
jgi:hypothetical protein